MPISSLRIIHIQDYGMVIKVLHFLHSLVPNKIISHHKKPKIKFVGYI